MKLPRDVSGRQIGKALRKLGYELTRETGSHMRFTTDRNGQHHIAIPDHNPIRVGTLQAILRDVASHHRLTISDLIDRLEL